MSLPSPGSNGIRECIQRAGKSRTMPDWLGWLICIPFILAMFLGILWAVGEAVEHFTTPAEAAQRVIVQKQTTKSEPERWRDIARIAKKLKM